MAELSSTLVKGKVDVTGKLKIKGKNVPSIYLNNELQEELKITMINGDFYIGEIAEVWSDTAYFYKKPIDADYETVYLSFGQNLQYSYSGGSIEEADGWTFQPYSTSTGTDIASSVI